MIAYESDIYQQMLRDFEQYEEEVNQVNKVKEFEDAITEEHQKRAPKGNPYIASFYQQVKALTIRQHHLLIKDKDAIISRYGTVLAQSLITSSCFLLIPLSGSGAFSRGGALFFLAVYNTFMSQSELVSFLMGRPILEKHKQYALYRPSAFYVAQVVMDIPYTLVQGKFDS